MILETQRLILRRWEDSDAESLYKYASDPDIGPIAGWPVHTSIENSLEIIRNVLSLEGTFALILKETGEPVGSIGLMSPSEDNKEAAAEELEVGYWIGKPYWGQGLVPEAVRCIQEFAFVGLETEALWCGYYDGNAKSKRAMEKCGFRYHHTEENVPCELMGDIRTVHYTYLTNKDWLKTILGL